MLTAIAEVDPLKAVWISGMFPVKKLAASKGPHKQGRNTPFLVTSPSQNTKYSNSTLGKSFPTPHRRVMLAGWERQLGKNHE